ncbi:MAG: heavy-metal-associated domain-containing protein ['Candidatus Kapabacteria' thiocyanatum]|uniref:HMA domain-containing protein n=1 Tax=Candidatus Kapaibacterium thiocyanatum TaxID=1895771 RepID=A0A1M3L585_9BACT|nr:heavy-metal-associated domain-containing protein ['Candidatus Kapabacteria' thiocyanatum]OJX60705.1 MAG: hypothetical protein BGO89_03790 ['Candidatus Kapabacteria' thiocyanatum]
MTTTLIIEGMTCQHCIRSIERALAKIDGVTVDAVDIGKATVTYDEAIVNTDRFAEAIGNAGYALVSTTITHAVAL